MAGMADRCVDKLATLDLSRYEAAVYVSLLQQGEATALELADLSGVPRQRVYDVLDSLSRKGLCRRKGERPRRHVVVNPETALPAMLEQRRRQQQADNERYARLIQELMTELQAVRRRLPATETRAGGDGADRPVGGL
ncbi:MAG: TrmB family transcriptional regulator [Anaerolineae bacterium]